MKCYDSDTYMYMQEVTKEQKIVLWCSNKFILGSLNVVSITTIKNFDLPYIQCNTMLHYSSKSMCI